MIYGNLNYIIKKIYSRIEIWIC